MIPARETFRSLAATGWREGRFVFAREGGALWHFPASGTDAEASFAVEIDLPEANLSSLNLSPRRLARAVRQDLWRTLRDVRGLWPVVRVGENRIAAGGLVAAPRDAGRCRDRLQYLFDDRCRGGWLASAARRHDRPTRDH